MPRGDGLKKIIIRPDENLARIIGNDKTTATEFTAKVWSYVKEHNLKEKLI